MTRLRTLLLTVVLAVAFTVTWAPPASAAPYNPTTWAELTADVAAAESGDIVALAGSITAPDGEGLVIPDDTTLTLDLNAHTLTILKPAAHEAGIRVTPTTTLIIQATGGGSLNVRSGIDASAIGGAHNGDGGTIIINGGTITAGSPGSNRGSGIGGGGTGHGGIVIINGGTVTATGGTYGSGIGGSDDGDGGTVTINGGTVTATGGFAATGIGGGGTGHGGTVTINGGTVTANGDSFSSGIGGSQGGDGGTVIINGGTVTATGGYSGSGIGGGWLGGDGGTVTISGGTVTATGGTGGSGIGGGDRGDGGTVTISGGTVTATGGTHGSGIGGGYLGDGGTVTVTGGTVTATGGTHGSGIGGGIGSISGGVLDVHAIPTPGSASTAGTGVSGAAGAALSSSATPAGVSYTATAVDGDGTVNASVHIQFHYLVSFDTGGGGTVPDQTVDGGVTVTEPATPVRAGYQFTGWRVGDASGPAWDFTTPVTSPLTLAASWQAQLAASGPDITGIVGAGALMLLLGGALTARRLVRSGHRLS